MNFPRFLIFPVSPQCERPIKLDRSGSGTINGTAPAVPAFLRVENDGRFALLGMGNIHIDLARFYTGIAPGADVRIEPYRIIRRIDIWKRKYFFLSHSILPYLPWYTPV